MLNAADANAGTSVPAPSTQSTPPVQSDKVAAMPDDKVAVKAGNRAAGQASPVVEIGGPTGPEPTRFGDWEKKGRCIDF